MKRSPAKSDSPLSVVPSEGTASAYLGRVITLELSSGHVLELGVAHVVNMRVMGLDFFPLNFSAVYDGLGTLLQDQIFFEGVFFFFFFFF